MVKITDAEWKIMNVLWEKEGSTITEITRSFRDTTGWTKHTVMTLLKRLDEKGAVYYTEGKKAKMFYTKIPRNEAAIEETKNFLDKAFQGKIGLMINTLIQEEALTKEELDELYDMLHKAGKEE